MAFKIGVVGLGVMGSNLALNMERNGSPVAGYDLDASKMRAFLEGPARGKKIIAVDSSAALMEALEKPRRILIMVPAGAVVDSAIDHLKPHLEPGDILMDGGNSAFLDRASQQDSRSSGISLHRDGCFRRRRRRTLGTGDHARRPARSVEGSCAKLPRHSCQG